MGTGLAGCLLAWCLEQRGIPVHLIGNSALPNASQVAAGVINPVTGRWMTKTWNIDRLLPEAEVMYQHLESQFHVKLYHSIPLFRYCQNADDAKRLGRRMRNPRYADVLGDSIPRGGGPAAIRDTCGSFEIRRTAYVDLPLLLETLRGHFIDKMTLRDESFAHADLKRVNTHWQYRGASFQAVIFCEGAGIRNNPWFAHLPLAPAKGETLHLESRTLHLPRAIYHHRKWILPYGDGTFRLGATFDESDLTPAPTEQGARTLLDAALDFLAPEHVLHIKHHLAGIRPCTTDARPLLGSHPAEPGLHVFNGLGSKGASIAPGLSQHFLDSVLEGSPLDPEADIRRFDPAPGTLTTAGRSRAGPSQHAPEDLSRE